MSSNNLVATKKGAQSVNWNANDQNMTFIDRLVNRLEYNWGFWRARNAPKKANWTPRTTESKETFGSGLDTNLGDAMDMEWLGNLEKPARKSICEEQLIMVAPQMQEPEVWSSQFTMQYRSSLWHGKAEVKPGVYVRTESTGYTSQHINWQVLYGTVAE